MCAFSARSTASLRSSVSAPDPPATIAGWSRPSVEQLAVLDKERGATHLLLELADVARPVMGDEGGQGGSRNAGRLNSALGAGAAEEVRGEVGDVGPPLAKRRQLHHPVRDPVVEIGSETAVVEHGREVPVGGRDHPNIGRVRFVAADAVDLALGEDAQDPGLGLGRHVADLVEEEGAAVGGLELAGAGVDPGGDAALDPEELALEEIAGQGGAVEGHQRLFRTV